MPSRVQSRLRVLDCNKDLVLCGFLDLARLSEESSRAYLVCNPFSKQWVALPLAPRKYAYYDSPAARLVCEPRARIKLDLGDDQSFIYSEHRFRVVCIYQARVENTIKLDVFCSESGEWSKEAFVFDSCDKIGPRSVISCNGELFLKYCASRANNMPNLVAGFNPFCLDMPPTSIDVSPFLMEAPWFISNSQDALHVIALENRTLPVRASVWRLEEDRKSWRKECEGLVNRTSLRRRYDVERCCEPFLHPDKPELVFFSRVADKSRNALMCCDLGWEEPTLFAKLERQSDAHHLQVFLPRFSCWATPIPSYKQLQGMCGGSSFCHESSNDAECPSLHFLNNW
ncbi:unnamed protein product [Linum tenue]|nr:unnamed protein product [Linum tenue]